MQVCKLNVAAKKRPGRSNKMWDEVLVDDKKKLRMESADPQNRSEWRGHLKKKTCQTNPTLGRGKQALKWI